MTALDQALAYREAIASALALASACRRDAAAGWGDPSWGRHMLAEAKRHDHRADWYASRAELLERISGVGISKDNKP